jgi:hypothetical protein
MNDLELLKMMAAREAYILPAKGKDKGLCWFNLMSSSPLISNYMSMTHNGGEYGQATDQGAEEVHIGSTEEDRQKEG